MARPSSAALHPALLPPGTVIGDWRVVAPAGCGVHGAVYRAVPSHDEHAPPVALKLAVHPENPRFAREIELLSQCDHPSIPRLLDHGTWLSPIGTHHPFLVLQWIDGVPLYEQPRLHPTESHHVRLWLLQLAQALAILHSRGAVHRDIKGDNILIRRSDGRAMLVDFGTGLYPGAAPLTPHMSFPGTPIYRPPEALLFEVQFYRDPTAIYRPSPADDLYALGVTACRLLTGKYPEPDTVFRDEQGTVHVDGVLLPPVFVRNPHVDPALRSIILRLLSVQPERRGTAAQLAQELEQTLRPPWRPSNAGDSTAPLKPRTLSRHEWALAAVGLALLIIAAWWALLIKPQKVQPIARAEPSKPDTADAGTAGLGDAASASVTEVEPSVSIEESLSADTLPEPLPGQVRPDEKGLCPGKALVALNGACWNQTAWGSERCLDFGGQMFMSSCYVPFISPGKKRSPTSGSMQNPR